MSIRLFQLWGLITLAGLLLFTGGDFDPAIHKVIQCGAAMFRERMEAVRMNSVLPAVLLLANMITVHAGDPGCWHLNTGILLTRLGLLSANDHLIEFCCVE